MAYTTIDNPELHFQTKLYTANQTDGTAITLDGSEDMSPNMCWWKNRDATYDHRIIDTVRGVTKILTPNTTAAEATNSNALASFDSDGFTVNADGDGYGLNYANTNKIVAWCWKAGGSASSNSNGDITSSVSANTTAGFSIVSYTGTDVAGDTVGHGLSAVPKWILVKRLAGSGYDWVVYHANDTAGLYLNSTGNNNDSSSNNIWFNGTAPTSSVFSIGTDGRIGDATSYIAYCFAEKQGYSKFGSYTGNGDADGAFVYTGFKPAFIMIKKSSGTENWSMYDTKRNVNGTSDTLPLNADNSSVESGNTGKNMDILSNGVKILTSNGELNGSGDTYIYMAFAESPFANSNGVPNNAR